MVAQFQQKPEKLLKRLAILEADAKPLTLVNNTLEGGIQPQQHLYFFGNLHRRATQEPVPEGTGHKKHKERLQPVEVAAVL